MPITDIKVAHKDLVLSTQGRSFWILDNLTVLHQLKPGAQNTLYAPRVAVRVPANGDAGRRGEGPQYPLMGAQIDYYLAADSKEPVTMDILDKSGKVVRSFTSVAPPARPKGRRKRMEEAMRRKAASVQPGQLFLIARRGCIALRGTCATRADRRPTGALCDEWAGCGSGRLPRFA